MFLLQSVKVDGTFLDSLKDIFLEFGLFQVFGIITGLVLLYILYKWTINYLSNKDKEKDKKIAELTQAMASMALDKNRSSISGLTHNLSIENINNIQQHPLFSNVEYLLGVKVNKTNFSSLTKKNIFSDFLYVRFTCSVDSWKNFLEEESHFEITREVLHSKITKLFIQIDNCAKELYAQTDIPSNVMFELQKSASLADTFLHSATETFIQSKVFKSAEDILYSILTLSIHINEVIFNNLILSLEKIQHLEDVEYNPKFTKNV